MNTLINESFDTWFDSDPVLPEEWRVPCQYLFWTEYILRCFGRPLTDLEADLLLQRYLKLSGLIHYVTDG